MKWPSKRNNLFVSFFGLGKEACRFHVPSPTVNAGHADLLRCFLLHQEDANKN